MGSQGSKPVDTSDVKNESHNSARNVFENIAEIIYNRVKEDAEKRGKSLKGDYKRAKFHQPLLEAAKYVWYAPSNPCNFDFRFDTNAPDKGSYDRDPCHLRDTNRFSDKGDAICTNNKINCNNGGCGACAPYRRIQLCDYNLEYINEYNINSTHDLLGNLLVMAKREGDSIVNSHGHTGKGIYKSGICTSLARSFADIGDIIRGKDLFLGHNHKKKPLLDNLEKIFNRFQKIYEDINNLPIDDIREYWWALNRNDVWEALTCSAPYYADYFKKKSGNTYNFTTEGYCGRNEGAPPTNLDYVPQFLRWFDEWAEEFCRIKNIKIGNIKKSCTGESNNKHCSREGYDCNKTNLRLNEIFMDLECPRCADDCKSYETWVENKKKEFNKQKEKYKEEINESKPGVNSEHGKYNKAFYDKLRTIYRTNDKFFEILNKGQICENVDEKNKIDFNDLVKTFSRSEYCKSCPMLGVTCKGEQCNSLDDITCTNDKGGPNKVTDKNNNTFVIDILLNDNKKKVLSNDLNDYKECDLFKRLRRQNWNCKYKCNLHVCELNNFNNEIDDERVISIKVFIKRWLESFLKDYNKLKENLNPCINNENQLPCIKDCLENCDCVEKWIKKKGEEWKKIKERYLKDYKIEDNNSSNSLNKFLQQNQFHSDVVKAIKPFENLRAFEDSSGCTGTVPSGIEECKSNDVIKILLSKLKEKIELCKKNDVKKNKSNNCVTLLKPLNDEEDDEEQDDEPPAPKPLPTPNPCVNGGDDTSGAQITSVTEIAEGMHMGAQKQMLERSGDKSGKGTENGESVLKGDIKKAKFKNGASPSSLEDVCGITDQHTKDSRRRRRLRRLRLLVLRFRRRLRRGHRDYKGPCTGKDGHKKMFQVEKGWENGSKIGTENDVFLPPRREHFCTSNVEHLYRSASGLQGTTASHSLLGDVLLAANKEAGFIKERYKTQKTSEGFKDEATVCRAIKYSFADIADIIKGTDLWKANSGKKNTQDKLVKIFQKIKDNLPVNIKGKYNEDEKHLELRKDWWFANRDKVWEAMKCEQNGITCSGPTPLDDYIPQRLRWMTEWAEWYCKAQKEAYDKLKVCEKCMDNGKCTQGNGECAKCKTACENYKKFINTWQPQWKQMEQKYESLYKEAQENGNSSHKSTTEQDKYMVEFLSQLQKANNGDKTGDDKVYSTAAGYVHQEATMNCEKQTQFCKNKNGVKAANDAEDVNYTFKDTPNGYDVVCKCKDRPEQQIKKKEVEDACKIAQDIFKGKDENTTVGLCKKKDFGRTPYPDWKCEKNSKLVTGNGECMPPRRQKLCLYFLAHKIETPNLNTQEDLRKAFIKCAAAETFFSWYYFKKINDKLNKLDEKLKEGEIPPQFLRSMFYTFGDYKDICLDTDISLKTENGDITKAKSNIDRIIPKKSAKNPDEERKIWWDGIKEDVWEGMLCGLSHAVSNNDKATVQKTLTTKTIYDYDTVTFDGTTKLEDFSKRPQFLRWMTEWGEEFCKKRKEQLENLKDKCPDYTCSFDTKKQECENHCKVYEEWLKGWKDQYKKQSEKFTTDKEKPEYKDDPDVASSENAHKYLSKKLKQIFHNGSTTEKCDYTCMEYASRQPQTSACSQQQQQQNKSSTQNHFPEAFDYPPKEIGDRCTCPKLPEPKYCVDKTAYDIRKESGKKSDNSLKGNGNTYNNNCNNSMREEYANQNGETCKFNETFWSKKKPSIEECDINAKERFQIQKYWDCNGKTPDGKNTFCIPPRRKDMCLKQLEEINSADVNNSKKLLQKIQDVAKKEGDDIIKKLLPKYPCNEDVICKAMKYSFADLADIVRGIDKYKGPNGTNVLEKELKSVFETIYTKWKSENTNNKSKYTDVASFRSAWWDANRKDIWNAMTCNAPYDAKIYITKEGGYISPLTFTKNKCGHNDDPPDYDYIPQPFRWLSEWSETYCLAQKDLLETMKNCENCMKKNKNADCEQTQYGACRDCKRKCEEYKKFIEIWKKQFETQNKAYQEIYRNATTTNRDNNNIVDENTKNFVKKLQENCRTDRNESLDTADKYLENASVCRRFKFGNKDSRHLNYAFHTDPPSYEEHCKCAKDFDPLDECPVDNNECKKYGIGSCPKKNFHKKLEEWTNYVLNNKSNKNKSAIVPPRRRQLCLQNLTRNLSRLNKEKSFKEGILISAASEAKMLTEQYRENPAKALQAIKYSFADIGNIIKGDDIIGNVISVQLNKLINGNKKINTSTLWWEANKEKIWNAMMCYYTGDEKTATSCPSHGNIDKEDQFLLWFQEWGENFCARQKELYEHVQAECSHVICVNGTGNIDSKCTEACKNYSNFISETKNVYQSLKKQYNDNHNSIKVGGKEVHHYMKEKCKDKCECLSEKFNSDNNWEKPYDTFDDTVLKNKCQCKKPDSPILPVEPSVPAETEKEKKKDSPLKPHTEPKPAPPKKPEVPPPPPVQPPPANQPFNRDILEKTIPFGIALALGSIAFLFIKKKGKSNIGIYLLKKKRE
ncbi:hypothetical protein PFNF54_01991 [Plasmodium falciparum NF54]|uniref:Erythrocyte membrane protein 1 n=1 Tax=Plasmodium falciparum (isolate NF54) TaxID=5843 RepID=W7K6X4_PLAFO|nr:hypothetical protein PFNF54_01991 [Plasmodium falciparum NF54]